MIDLVGLGLQLKQMAYTDDSIHSEHCRYKHNRGQEDTERESPIDIQTDRQRDKEE